MCGWVEKRQTHDGFLTNFKASKGSLRALEAFFWQSPGVVAPYLVALLLFQLMPGDTNRQFRWVLGLGAVPSLIAMLAVPQEEEVMRRFWAISVGKSGETWRLCGKSGIFVGRGSGFPWK